MRPITHRPDGLKQAALASCGRASKAGRMTAFGRRTPRLGRPLLAGSGHDARASEQSPLTPQRPAASAASSASARRLHVEVREVVARQGQCFRADRGEHPGRRTLTNQLVKERPVARSTRPSTGPRLRVRLVAMTPGAHRVGGLLGAGEMACERQCTPGQERPLRSPDRTPEGGPRPTLDNERLAVQAGHRLCGNKRGEQVRLSAPPD
jgi:hypothetical protein